MSTATQNKITMKSLQEQVTALENHQKKLMAMILELREGGGRKAVSQPKNTNFRYADLNRAVGALVKTLIEDLGIKPTRVGRLKKGQSLKTFETVMAVNVDEEGRPILSVWSFKKALSEGPVNVYLRAWALKMAGGKATSKLTRLQWFLAAVEAVKSAAKEEAAKAAAGEAKPAEEAVEVSESALDLSDVE